MKYFIIYFTKKWPLFVNSLSLDVIQDVNINEIELPQENEDSEEEEDNRDVEPMMID